MKFSILWISSLALLKCSVLAQVPSDKNYAFSDKVSALKSKSSEHERQISELLSESNLTPTNFDLPVRRTNAVPSLESMPPVPPAPYLPVPEYYEVKKPREISVPNKTVVPSTLPQVSSVTSAENNESNLSKGLELSDPDDATNPSNSDNADSVSTEVIVYERHEGYYFGPLIGFTFPKDGAVRDIGNGKIPFESESGYVLGLQFGKDFDTVRWEAEYSFQGFDGQAIGGGNNYKVGSHGLLTRLVIERELGESFDLRAGLGMGVGFISIEDSQEYSGESFIYDFGIGVGYRFRENLSLGIDYRYFLSAAEDAYDRISSHMFVASANFDL